MDKPEPVAKSEKQRIFWDLEIQTDHPIQARRTDLILSKKDMT